MSLTRKLLAVFLVACAAAAFIDHSHNGDQPSVATAAPAAAPAKKQKPTNDEINATSAAQAVLAIRETAREPESFKLATVLSMPKGVCMEYRQRNGFGGMNVDRAVAVGKKLRMSGSEDFSDMWNQYCTKTGTDITDQVSNLIHAIDGAQGGR